MLPPSSELIALMMQTANTAETSVNFYYPTLRNNPEDSHLHTFICLPWYLFGLFIPGLFNEAFN
jgi:hypothetical protein